MENKETYFDENTFGLSQEDIKKINSVFEKIQNIEEVIIFGSRAKGNFKKYSDIDFSLIGENLTLKTIFEVEILLDELFLPYMFDINIKNQISNQELLEHMDRVGISFYKRELPIPDNLLSQ